MSSITIYQKTAADYANEQASINGVGYRAQQAANAFSLKLMAQHLHFEHGVKINALAKRLGIKRNYLLGLLK
jgi:hypothetical protein